MKKKIVAMCATVALAAVAVGGTLAYFTDVESQKNTFTVGDVDITLTETDIDGKDGARTSEDQVFGVIMPDTVYVKDPIIENTGSQNAYVFLEMNLNKYVSLINLMGVHAYETGVAGLQGEYPGFTAFLTALVADADLRAEVVGNWFTGIDHSAWQVMNLEDLYGLTEAPARLSIVLGYKTVLEPGDEAAFMETFTMPATVTQDMFSDDLNSNFNTDQVDFEIVFTAHAIQEAELDTLEDAYAALFA